MPKNEEKKRLAEEKRQEKKRVAEEKRQEKKRVAEEKRQEKKRLAEEKRQEKKRLAEEKRQEKKTDTVTKKRKNVDTNAYEYVIAVLILNPEFVCKGDIVSWVVDESRLCGCDSSTIDAYKMDLETRPVHEVDKYILNYKLHAPSQNEPVLRVYLEGKNCRSQPIVVLNEGLDVKQQKADIYVECADGFYGISIKQDDRCTKSNYSVEKMIGMISPDCGTELNECRKTFLRENGFEKYPKSERECVNKLFHVTNPYWELVRTKLTTHNECIKRSIIKNMFPDVPYKLYEYDGNSMYLLDNATENVTLVEHAPYYVDTQGNHRNAAKLFYQLIVNEKIFRVEIRWKGNIWGASPQFQIHAN
jgi:hypothetical protein